MPELLVLMTADTLKALTWDVLCAGASRSYLHALWSAVQARHRYYGQAPPITGRGEFQAWSRAISCVMGRLLSLKLPIHKSIVALLLVCRPTTLGDNCDRLITALASLACLRVLETAAPQVCDAWFDFFLAYGIRGY